MGLTQVRSGRADRAGEITTAGVRDGKGLGEGGIEVGRSEGVGDASGSGDVDASSVRCVEAIAGGVAVPTRADALHCSAKNVIAPISPRQSDPKHIRINRCVRVIDVEHITERPRRQIRGAVQKVVFGCTI